MNAEQQRLEQNNHREQHWHLWGPYLSERQWGTVREDYSANGDAWNYFSARARPVPRLSLGRRWNRRHLRFQAAALFCFRLLE